MARPEVQILCPCRGRLIRVAGLSQSGYRRLRIDLPNKISPSDFTGSTSRAAVVTRPGEWNTSHRSGVLEGIHGCGIITHRK